MAIFKVYPRSRQAVAKAGEWGLYENVFVLERVSTADLQERLAFPSFLQDRLAHLSYQALLPSPERREYVDVSEAYEETGISKRKLRALCRKGVLEAKKVKGRWLIHRRSLREYLESLPA